MSEISSNNHMAKLFELAKECPWLPTLRTTVKVIGVDNLFVELPLQKNPGTNYLTLPDHDDNITTAFIHQIEEVVNALYTHTGFTDAVIGLGTRRYLLAEEGSNSYEHADAYVFCAESVDGISVFCPSADKTPEVSAWTFSEELSCKTWVMGIIDITDDDCDEV